MKLNDFVYRMAKLLKKHGCTVKSCHYYSELGNEEITDTYDFRFRMYSTSLNVSDVLFTIEFYIRDISVRIHIKASRCYMTDILIALLEMKMPRLMIQSMAYLADKEHLFFTLQEIVEDIVLSDNDTALDIALNTNLEMICREDLYCLSSLSRAHIQYGPFGIAIPQELFAAFGLPSEFLRKLVIDYPKSTKCIPILLRYLEDHFVLDDTKEIGL